MASGTSTFLSFDLTRNSLLDQTFSLSNDLSVGLCRWNNYWYSLDYTDSKIYAYDNNFNLVSSQHINYESGMTGGDGLTTDGVSLFVLANDSTNNNARAIFVFTTSGYQRKFTPSSPSTFGNGIAYDETNNVLWVGGSTGSFSSGTVTFYPMSKITGTASSLGLINGVSGHDRAKGLVWTNDVLVTSDDSGDRFYVYKVSDKTLITSINYATSPGVTGIGKFNERLYLGDSHNDDIDVWNINSRYRITNAESFGYIINQSLTTITKEIPSTYSIKERITKEIPSQYSIETITTITKEIPSQYVIDKYPTYRIDGAWTGLFTHDGVLYGTNNVDDILYSITFPDTITSIFSLGTVPVQGMSRYEDYYHGIENNTSDTVVRDTSGDPITDTNIIRSFGFTNPRGITFRSDGACYISRQNSTEITINQDGTNTIVDIQTSLNGLVTQGGVLFGIDSVNKMIKGWSISGNTLTEDTSYDISLDIDEGLTSIAILDGDFILGTGNQSDKIFQITPSYTIPSTITITKEIPSQYSIIKRVKKTTRSKYNIEKRITKTTPSNYSIKKQIIQTIPSQYTIITGTMKTVPSRYSIIQRITKTIPSQYDIKEPITKTILSRYLINIIPLNITGIEPTGLTAYSDRLYVASDESNHKAYAYSFDGTYHSEDDLPFDNPVAGLTNKNGTFYYVDIVGDLIYEYVEGGTDIARFIVELANIDNVRCLAWYEENDEFLLGSDKNDRVYRYDTLWNELGSFPLYTDNTDNPTNPINRKPTGMDTRGNRIYVMDGNSNIVFVYDINGNTYPDEYISVPSDPAVGAGIAINDGILYVVLENSPNIHIYPLADIPITVTKTIPSQYSIIAKIIKTIPSQYSIIAKIIKTIHSSYSIETSTIITKTIPSRYDIEEKITKTIPSNYSIKEQITKTIPSNYSIIQQITKTIPSQYSIETSTTIIKTIPSQYSIIAYITHIIAGAWTGLFSYDDVLYGANNVDDILYSITFPDTITSIFPLGASAIQGMSRHGDYYHRVQNGAFNTIVRDLDGATIDDSTIVRTFGFDNPRGITFRNDGACYISRGGSNEITINQNGTNTIVDIGANLNGLVIQGGVLFGIDNINKMIKGWSISDNMLTRDTNYDIPLGIIEGLTSIAILNGDFILGTNNQTDKIFQITPSYIIPLDSIVKEIESSYSIIQQITKTIPSQYDIKGRIIKTIPSQYNIKGQIIKTIPSQYSIEERIIKTIPSQYDIKSTIPKEITSQYMIHSKIEKNIPSQYSIEGRIIKTIPSQYSIKGQIIKTILSQYSIEGRIIKTIPSQYSIEEQITKTIPSQYHIKTTISKEIISQYMIQFKIEKTIPSQYSIEEQITKTTPSQYDIKTTISKEVQSQYYVDKYPTYRIAGAWTGLLTFNDTIYGLNNQDDHIYEITLPDTATSILTLPSGGVQGLSRYGDYYHYVQVNNASTIVVDLSGTPISSEAIVHGLNAPRGITFDNSGQCYVSSTNTNEVSIIPNGGTAVIQNITHRLNGLVEQDGYLYGIDIDENIRVYSISGTTLTHISNNDIMLNDINVNITSMTLYQGDFLLGTVAQSDHIYRITPSFTRSKTVSSQYGIQNTISKTTPSQYSIKSLITKDIPSQYSIIGKTVKNISSQYSIIQIITKEISSQYGTLNTIPKEIPSRYTTKRTISKDIPSQYGILNTTPKEIPSRYVIKEIIPKNIPSQYGILNTIPKEIPSLYAIKEIIPKNIPSQYGILNTIPKEIPSLYAIKEIIPKDIPSQYGILNTIPKEIPSQYSTKRTISKDIPSQYGIRNIISKEIPSQYSIIGRTTKEISSQYNIKEQITKTIQSQYFIGIIPLNNTGIIPTGITAHLNRLYVASDESNHKAYAYSFDGTYHSENDLSFENAVAGLTNRNGTFYYVDIVSDVVYQHGFVDTPVFAADLAVIDNVRCITWYEDTNEFLLGSDRRNRIYKYDTLWNQTGTIDLDSNNQRPTGMATRGNRVYVMDADSNMVFVYNIDGTPYPDEYISIPSDSGIGGGITINDGLLYVVLQNKSNIYIYPLPAISTIKKVSSQYGIKNTISKDISSQYSIVQRITKEIPSQYSIIGRTIKTIPSQYDIKSRIEKTTPSQYSINILIENEIPSQYDIHSRIEKEIPSQYSINGAIRKTIPSQYSIKTLIENEIPSQYSIKTLIENEIPSQYSINGAIIKTIPSQYSIKTLIESEIPSQYSIKTLIENEIPSQYSIKTLIENEIPSQYSINGAIIKTIPSQYSIKTLIESEIPSQYSIHRLIEKTTPSQYDIKSRIIKTIPSQYSIKTLIESEIPSQYSINGAIIKTIPSQYSIKTLIESEIPSQYSIHRLIEKTTPSQYDIKSRIEKTIPSQYSINGAIIKTIPSRYDIKSITDKTIPSQYSIHRLIEKTTPSQYDINIMIEKTTPSQYIINGVIRKTIPSQYDIKFTIDKTIPSRYDIKSIIDRIIPSQYSIIQKITKTISSQYRVEKYKTYVIPESWTGLTTSSDGTIYALNNIGKQVHSINLDQLTTTVTFDLPTGGYQGLSIYNDLFYTIRKSDTEVTPYDSNGDPSGTALTHGFSQVGGIDFHSDGRCFVSEVGASTEADTRLAIIDNGVTTYFTTGIELPGMVISGDVLYALNMDHDIIAYDISTNTPSRLTQYDISLSMLDGLKGLTIIDGDFLISTKASSNNFYRISPMYHVETIINSQYSIKSKITKTISSRYNVNITIEKTIPSQYQIGLRPTKTINSSYSIEARIIKTVPAQYEIKNTIPTEHPSQYGIKNTIPKEISSQYEIIGIIRKTVPSQYEIKNTIPTEHSSQYKIKNTIPTEHPSQYSIIQRISKEIPSKYEIVGIVKKTVPSQYKIIGIVRKTIPSRYNITRQIIKSIQSTYSILRKIFKTIASTYILQGIIIKSIQSRYDIISDGIIRKEIHSRYGIFGEPDVIESIRIPHISFERVNIAI